MEESDKTKSCSEGLSRSEFLSKVVDKAKLVGTMYVGLKIVDTYVCPPQAAMATSFEKESA